MDSFHISCTTINSQWIIHLNAREKKIESGKIGINFYYFMKSKVSIDMIPKE